MKKDYKLAPMSQKERDFLRNLDRQRRIKVEAELGKELTDIGWEQYKLISIKRRK